MTSTARPRRPRPTGLPSRAVAETRAYRGKWQPGGCAPPAARAFRAPYAARPSLAAALALVALVALAGCGATGSTPPGDAVLTVYVSAPLSGPARAEGQEVADGARRALDDAGAEAGGVDVRARYLDVAGRNETRFDPVTAAANARSAAEDSTAIAYVGELDSGATRTSSPILNEAGILQAAPGSGAEDLVRAGAASDDVPLEVQPTGERTFARLVPTYERGRAPAKPPGTPEELGYEAMASILAAIDRAEDPLDRGSVVAAYFDGTARDALGGYRIAPTGEFTPAD